MRPILIVLLVILTGICVSCDPSSSEEPLETAESPKALPFTIESWVTMDQYQSEGSNWRIGGSAIGDPDTKYDMQLGAGTGLLANVPGEGKNTDIYSSWSHGDLDMSIEFLVPKGSNSGIYFQSRYEIQILDSWGKDEVGFGDCGGIYERWDESKPEGQKGYEGIAPAINASRSPGLWQEFRARFRAPRFDSVGNKIANARFLEVYHNGVLIHKDVELKGPTRGTVSEEEVASAPLRIQGDHGPVAFRNFHYKSYSLDTIAVQDLEYALYDIEEDALPDFNSIQPIKQGSIDRIEIRDLDAPNENYATRFTGTMELPVSGEYLFMIQIDDGGDLYIDSQHVVHYDRDGDLRREGALINLTAGTHTFELTHFQVVWLSTAAIFYEGPGISMRPLVSVDVKKEWGKPSPMYFESTEHPEMIRSFVNYRDESPRTHAISVGDPSGLHYSYDLQEGSLLRCWKGKFAEVTHLWVNRGQSQLLIPMNAVVEPEVGPVYAHLKSATANWPDKYPKGFNPMGYEMGGDERPIYLYHQNGVSWRDQIMPAADAKEINRTLVFQSESAGKNHFCRIAAGKQIEKLTNGTYRIDGQYFLRTNSAAELIQLTDKQELRVPILTQNNTSELSYSLSW